MISYQFSSSSHQNGWSQKAEIPNVEVHKIQDLMYYMTFNVATETLESRSEKPGEF
jgi:hypothetical protein